MFERTHVVLLGLAAAAIFLWSSARRASAVVGAPSTAYTPVVPGVFGDAASFVVGGDPGSAVNVNDYCTQHPEDAICGGIVAVPENPGSILPGDVGGGSLPGSYTGPVLLTP